MHCRRRAAISSAGQLPVPATLDTHFPTLPDVDGDSIHPLPGICNGVRRENCGGVEPRPYGSATRGAMGGRPQGSPLRVHYWWCVGEGVRIATGAVRPRNDIAFARGTVRNRRADRGVRPYGSVTRGAMGGRPQGSPLRKCILRCAGEPFCIEKTTVRVGRSFFIEDFTQPWEPRARQPERPQRQPWQQRPSSRRQPSARP